jgi:hypothetical protein
MSTEITVRGSYAAFQQPERGTAHVSISYEGADMEPVYERVARDLEAVKATVLPLLDGERGPVTWWSVEQLHTWSAHPWNSDGEQLPLVHHASVGVQVKFLDFQALSRWIGQHVADTEGFRLARVEWALTVERRAELAKEVRTRAVQDAVDRAQHYADALGLGSVVPIAISDVGMLKMEGSFIDAQPRAMSDARGVPDVEFVPEDIELAAEVDARFLADVR